MDETIETTDPQAPAGQMMDREKPDLDAAAVAYIKSWHQKIVRVRDASMDKAFKRMRQDMAFAAGRQWGDETSTDEDRYVCNIIHRHIQQRVASLYARNPTAEAKPREQLDFTLWDGTSEQLQIAMQMPNDPVMRMVLEDAASVMGERAMKKRLGKTLELLWKYFIGEGTPTFKVQLKQLVRRVCTTGVGYLKIGFQREMAQSPDLLARVRDFTLKLEHLRALLMDMADGEILPESAEYEEARLALEALQTQKDVITHEGLTFDFPRSTAILIDDGCINLNGFIGAGWIAEEYQMTPSEVKDIFGVDVGKDYRSYRKQMFYGCPRWDVSATGNEVKKDEDSCCVWEVHDLVNGVRMFLCDGYSDYLEEPGPPPVFFERGHPYLSLTFNDVEDEMTIFPPSDARMLRHQQLEWNRSRDAFREHRIANTPAYVSLGGIMTNPDVMRFANHTPHELIILDIPYDDKADVAKIVQRKPTTPIDPALYDVEFLFSDILRSTGNQEPNFGGTSGATATESSIAENARVGSVEANVDDLDEFLSDTARASGQILLAEMSPEQVAKIVGRGAVWPEMLNDEIAKEIVLVIRAGSSGRPNKAADLANWERIMPFLIQIPGINPTWLGKEQLRRLDDNIDLEEAIVEGMPSILAMQTMAKAAQAGAPAGPGAAPGATEGTGAGIPAPAAQGAQGAANQPQGPAAQGPQPAFPAGSEALQ